VIYVFLRHSTTAANKILILTHFAIALGVDDAAEQAVPTSQSWARPVYEGGMHWSTYKAVCRHRGSYSSMARGV